MDTTNSTLTYTTYSSNMPLCESCTHSSICKYREEALKFTKEFKASAPSPLSVKIECEHYSSGYHNKGWGQDEWWKSPYTYADSTANTPPHPTYLTTSSETITTKI